MGQQLNNEQPLIPFHSSVCPVGESSDPLSMTGSSWQWHLRPQRYSTRGDDSLCGASQSWNSVPQQNSLASKKSSQEDGDPWDLNGVYAIVFEYGRCPANESSMDDMQSLDVSLAPSREPNKSSIRQSVQGTRSHDGNKNTTLRRSKVSFMMPSNAINFLEEEEAHDGKTQECVVSSNEGVSGDDGGAIHNILDGASKQYAKLKPEARTPTPEDLPYPHWIFQVEAQGIGDADIGKYHTVVDRGPRRPPLSVQARPEESCGMVGNVDMTPVANVMMTEEVVSEHRSRDGELGECLPMIKQCIEMLLSGHPSPKQRNEKTARRDVVASEEKISCSIRAEDLSSSQLEGNPPLCCASDEFCTRETPSPQPAASAITPPVCGDEVIQEETTLHEGKEDGVVPPSVTKTCILGRNSSRPRTPEPVPFDEQETDNDSCIALTQRSPTSVGALFLKDTGNKTHQVDELGTASCDNGAKTDLDTGHGKPTNFGNASSESQLVDSCLAVQDSFYDLFENSADSKDGNTSPDREGAPRNASDDNGFVPPFVADMRTISKHVDEEIVARDRRTPDCEKHKKSKKVSNMALLTRRRLKTKNAAPAASAPGLAEFHPQASMAGKNGKRASRSKVPSDSAMADNFWSTHDFVCTLFGSPQDVTTLKREEVWIAADSLCEIIAFPCQAQVGGTSDDFKQGHLDANETRASEAIEEEGSTTRYRRELYSDPIVHSLMYTTDHNDARLGATSSSSPEIAALQQLVKVQPQEESSSVIDEATEMEEWIYPSDRPGGDIGERNRCNNYFPRWGWRRLPGPLQQPAWYHTLCAIQESLHSAFLSCQVQRDFDYSITVPASVDSDSDSDDDFSSDLEGSLFLRYSRDQCRVGGGDMDDTHFVHCGPHLASRSWTTACDEASEVSEGWSLRT